MSRTRLPAVRNRYRAMNVSVELVMVARLDSCSPPLVNQD